MTAIPVPFNQTALMTTHANLNWQAQRWNAQNHGYQIIGGLCYAISARFIFEAATGNWIANAGFVNLVTNFVNFTVQDTITSSLQTAYHESYYNELNLPGNGTGLSSQAHMRLSADFLNANCPAVNAIPRQVSGHIYPHVLSQTFLAEIAQNPVNLAMLQHGANYANAAHAVVIGQALGGRFLFDPNFGLLYPLQPNDILEHFQFYDISWYCIIDC